MSHAIEQLTIRGWLVVTIRDAAGRVTYHSVIRNIITQIGDEYYGERAAGIASPPDQVTGMRLGTGTTTPSKTGIGAAIGTYVSGSAKAIDGSYPASALSAGLRRITWKTTWIAGEATSNGISEVALTNETPLTDVVGTAANTIARALLLPIANKPADGVMDVEWNHDIGALS